LPLPEIKPRFLGYPASSLVAVLIVLFNGLAIRRSQCFFLRALSFKGITEGAWDGGYALLRTVGAYLPNCMTSDTKRQ